MSDNRYVQMKAIRDEVVALTSSPLYEYRVKNGFLPVIGEGSHTAACMFVGEAPGRNEAKTGRPFCGAAGKILDELLASIHIERPNVYITNIVKDRPPENRDPTPEEIAAYGPFLNRQIEIIKPKVIATLGRYSMQYVFDMFSMGTLGSISTLHGKEFAAEAPHGPIRIVALYHPAAAIYNQHLKKTLLEDFNVLSNALQSTN